MTRADRQYRSRVEILRDFLGAVRESGKKTRVIGLANLNPASYQPYLDFCLAHHLVQYTSEGYRLTPRADGVLEAIERLVARSAEVDAALLDLQRGLDATNPSAPSTKPALRYVSLVAFNEIARSTAESLGVGAELPESHGSVDLTAREAPTWSQRAVAPGLESRGADAQPIPGAASISGGRRPRAGRRQ